MDLKPPLARRIPHALEKHGQVRIDNYYWLNGREDPAVFRYLEAENRYTDAVMAHTSSLQETLFQEIKERIQQDESSVPYLRDGYYYYTRYEEGREYPFYCRKKASLLAREEVMLDANDLAADEDYFSVGGWSVSDSGSTLAYATDLVGRRIYNVYFKDLKAGTLLDEVITNVTANMVWANDDRTFYYAKQDPRTLRSFRIYRHLLGTDPSHDSLVYEETDEEYRAYVWKTKSKKYLMIACSQTLSTEYRILNTREPEGEFKVFHPREKELEYRIDHLGESFYILTNLDAGNFRLMETPVARTEKSHWRDVVPHRPEVLLENFELFREFLVLEERRGGLIHLRIMPWSGTGEHYLDFGEAAYHAALHDNFGMDTRVLRYTYTSLTTPDSTFDYDMVRRDKKLLKQDQVLGGFRMDDYASARLEATARDGSHVPISLVYRKSTPPDGNNPILVYAYGSYGISMDASFNAARLSLLDRGFTFAIAHVRGGEELGRSWYEDGKLLKKKNTFCDFLDCVEYLIEKGYASPGRVFAAGASAGGLLMGVVINMRPDLFRGVVAAVPFVDIVTSMLDSSLPLTTFEYDEWGDPNVREYYDYILSYSPYDNVEARAYPHLLVTAGLHDSQVQYWEPAKWVAKLRRMKTDGNRLLLRIRMEAGHWGVSGRFRRYRETALEYAFMLDLLGIRE